MKERLFIGVVLAVLAHGTFCSAGGRAKSHPDGALIKRRPYVFPFRKYEEFCKAYGKGSPQGSSDWRRRFPKKIFDDLVGRGGVLAQSIVYASDGLRVKGVLVKPRRRRRRRLPVVIYCRGGNREFGRIGFAHLFRLWKLASAGYMVLASQYRGNAGGEGREEFGGRDIRDVLNLLPLVDRLPGADPSRIALFGWSRGGLMVYLALTRSRRFRAAVVGAGLADSRDMIRRRPGMESVYRELVPGYEKNRQAALEARSPVRFADEFCKTTPLLLLHGTADWRVHPSQALVMARRLLSVRHPFRLLLLEGGNHGLHEHAQEVDRQVLDWLDRYCRDRKAWPSLVPHGR